MLESWEEQNASCDESAQGDPPKQQQQQQQQQKTFRAWSQAWTVNYKKTPEWLVKLLKLDVISDGLNLYKYLPGKDVVETSLIRKGRTWLV